jgi:hypothetical protein
MNPMILTTPPKPSMIAAARNPSLYRLRNFEERSVIVSPGTAAPPANSPGAVKEALHFQQQSRLDAFSAPQF